MTFKVGDRVRVVKVLDEDGYPYEGDPEFDPVVGDIGEVDETWEDGPFTVSVHFAKHADNESFSFNDDDLEPVL